MRTTAGVLGRHLPALTDGERGAATRPPGVSRAGRPPNGHRLASATVGAADAAESSYRSFVACERWGVVLRWRPVC
ncbi:MAG TPA: hypothetical protein VEF89_24050 [Solirubrobacteraceae bacterium]|nr:hypothetical protein [Solirubrobacteraceae bacterium]